MIRDSTVLKQRASANERWMAVNDMIQIALESAMFLL